MRRTNKPLKCWLAFFLSSAVLSSSECTLTCFLGVPVTKTSSSHVSISRHLLHVQTHIWNASKFILLQFFKRNIFKSWKHVHPSSVCLILNKIRFYLPCQVSYFENYKQKEEKPGTVLVNKGAIPASFVCLQLQTWKAKFSERIWNSEVCF